MTGDLLAGALVTPSGKVGENVYSMCCKISNGDKNQVIQSSESSVCGKGLGKFYNEQILFDLLMSYGVIKWHFWLFGVTHPGGGGTMVMVLIQMKLCQDSHLVWPWVGTRYKSCQVNFN